MFHQHKMLRQANHHACSFIQPYPGDSRRVRPRQRDEHWDERSDQHRDERSVQQWDERSDER